MTKRTSDEMTVLAKQWLAEGVPDEEVSLRIAAWIGSETAEEEEDELIALRLMKKVLGRQRPG